MRNIIVFLVIFLIISVFASQSCKDKPKTQVLISISEQMKEYSVFKSGSYWVFINDINGRTDSCYIEKPAKFTFIQKDYPNVDSIWEYCGIFYGGNFIYGTWIDNNFYGIGLNSGTGNPCLSKDNFQPGFTYSFNANHILRNMTFYDSIVINGNSFYSVMVTQYLSYVEFNDTIKYTYYLGKNIGLIQYNRKEKNSDTTWSLQRYKIIQ